MKTAPLSIAFNVAVVQISNQIFPLGFDISSEVPTTFQGIIDHYERTGRIIVWNGATDATIFADPEIACQFRAWHDSKHILFRFGFTRLGEESVMGKQWEDIRALYDGPAALHFCKIINANLRGVLDYLSARGGYPLNQMAFVKAYLNNPSEAIAGDFGLSVPHADR